MVWNPVTRLSLGDTREPARKRKREEGESMDLKPAQSLGQLGKLYRMPENVAAGSEDVRKAWAIGVFTGAVGEGMFETKEIAVTDVVKTYERLEIHDLSPQMYAVLSGGVAVPIAMQLDCNAVAFYEVRKGEAIVVNPKVWHGGPVGVSIPARVLVVLKSKTSELDTKKANVSPPVEAVFGSLKA